LPAGRLAGAALYYDAQMDDAQLVVAKAIDAAAHGAGVRTRTTIVALERGRDGAAAGWRATTAAGETIVARLVVNAAGPWVDRVRGLAAPGAAAAAPSLRPTRGTHVVVPALTRGHALLLFAEDRRVFFVLPHGARSLVGTTDVDFAGDPATVRPTGADVRYLQGEIERRWPGHGGPVGRAIAGLRPLAATGGGVALPWRNTREARILEEDGVLSLTGGKYTTARRLAEHAVDRAIAQLDAAARTRPGDTAAAMLPARPAAPAAGETTATDPPLARADVEHAVRHEFACTAGDVIWRRSDLWLDRAAARAAAPAVAAWMAPLLGWNDAQRAAEVRAVHEACDEEERWLDEA
jgi:glycerol-3-phosphate dehydrogenase